MKKTDYNNAKGRQTYVAGRGASSNKKMHGLIVFVLVVFGVAFLWYFKSHQNPPLPIKKLLMPETVVYQEGLVPIQTEKLEAKVLETKGLQVTTINDEGLALMKAESYDEAIEKFSQAVELLPSDEVLRNNLALAYVASGWNSLRNKEYENALETFAHSLDINPSSAAYKGRGVVFVETGKHSDALIELDKAISLDKDDAQAHILMGKLLYEMNRLAEAGSHLTLALDIDPSNISAVAFMEKVERETVEDSFDDAESPNFFVKYEGYENAETGHLLLMVLEEAYHAAGTSFGLYLEEPVTVILYSNQQFSDVTRSPSWSGGLYDGKIRLPSGGISQKTDELTRVVYHEYTHALIHRVTGGNCPTWFNEGLAQLEEGADISRAKNFLEQRGGPVPLGLLEGSFLGLDGPTASKAYATSLLAVDYIANEYSYIYIKDILVSLGEGKTISEAIGSVLYISYDDIEKGFNDSL